MSNASESTMRLNYRYTFLLGIGFLSISLVWSVFNSYVPIFLKSYITSTWLVGVVMALDNVAGLTLQPWFSGLSDRCRSRFGRRLPFLMVGAPPAALLFMLLPGAGTLIALVGTIVVVDLFMSVFRGPTVALMPDVTPAPLRSKANGVINFMGGLGALIALFLGSQLYKINHFYPFILASIVMMIAVLLLIRYMRIPVGETKPDEAKQVQGGVARALLETVRAKDKSGIRILAAIFFWFIAWNGAETFFTTYGKFALGVAESDAAFAMGFFSLSFLIFAIPSGLLATRIGRRRTIILGILGMIIVMLGLYLVKSLVAIEAVFLLGGLAWALININSYPMVAELAGTQQVGAFTGLYYFFSSLAAVLAPPFFGFVMDKVGYASLFPVGSIFLLVALVLIWGTKRGESVPTTITQCSESATNAR